MKYIKTNLKKYFEELDAKGRTEFEYWDQKFKEMEESSTNLINQLDSITTSYEEKAAQIKNELNTKKRFIERQKQKITETEKEFLDDGQKKALIDNADKLINSIGEIPGIDGD